MSSGNRNRLTEELRFVSWRHIKEGSPAKTSQVPVLIISLDDQNERRRLLSRRGIEPDWIENYWQATDLRNKSALELKEALLDGGYVYDSQWPSSVIGCALSHGKAAEWQVLSSKALILVLEDDVVPALENYLEILLSVANELLPAAVAGESFVCHLGARPEQMRETYSRPVKITRCSTNDEWSMRLHIDPRPTLWRAHAYLISFAAAQKLAHRDKQLLTVADDWSARRELGFFDRLYVVTPRLFLQDEEVNSTLDHTRDASTQTHGRQQRGFLQRVLASLKLRTRIAKAQLLARYSTSISSKLR